MSYSITELENAVKSIGEQKDASEYMFQEGKILINDTALDLSITYRLGHDQFESAREHAQEILSNCYQIIKY